MARRKKKQLKLDEVGYWSEVKLDIVRDYAKAYSTILAAQQNPSFEHVYIDAFAGAGIHISKTTGEVIEGSPLIAVSTQLHCAPSAGPVTCTLLDHARSLSLCLGHDVRFLPT
jgi:three-Cys-motif partner protein